MHPRSWHVANEWLVISVSAGDSRSRGRCGVTAGTGGVPESCGFVSGARGNPVRGAGRVSVGATDCGAIWSILLSGKGLCPPHSVSVESLFSVGFRWCDRRHESCRRPPHRWSEVVLSRPLGLPWLRSAMSRPVGVMWRPRLRPGLFVAVHSRRGCGRGDCGFTRCGCGCKRGD